MQKNLSPAVQRRIFKIRTELRAARREKFSQETMASMLCVDPRSLRDWERGNDVPNMKNAITWAETLNYRFIIRDRMNEIAYAPQMRWELDWQTQEYRRWAPPLKKRREERRISQTHLGLLLGVSRSTMERRENGMQMPTFHSMIEWCDRLSFTFELISKKKLPDMTLTPEQALAAGFIIHG